MNDIIGKKTIIYLPVDFICYAGDDGAVSFEKFEAYFGQVAKGKKGNIEYSSIHARVAAVYSALCEGKIEIGDINRIED